MMIKPIVLFVVALFLMPLVSADDEADVTVYLVSAAALPVGNANITLRDASDNTTIASVLSDNTTGLATFEDVNSTDYPEFNFKIVYPSSSYTASLTNVSCDSSPLLNDFGSVSVVVTNTLGEYLEAQDGSVFVTETADSDKKIIVFNTTCRTGEQFIDDDGNWVSFTQCPVSDSRGNYNYVFPVLEKDGFFYNENYTVHVVINGLEESCNFTTALPRHVDADKWAAFGKQLGGVVFVMVFIILSYLVIRRMKWRVN